MDVRRAFVAIGWQSLPLAQSFSLSTQGSSRVNGRTRAAAERRWVSSSYIMMISVLLNLAGAKISLCLFLFVSAQARLQQDVHHK